MSETTTPREGERIDEERLREYLSERLGRTERLRISQFPAGSSNLTYLIKIGEDEFVLRRPPFGNTVKTAHDMRREHDMLARLSAVYAPAPRPLLFCGEVAVIGSEFYLMERRLGVIVRNRATTEQVGESTVGRFETDYEFQREVCRAFIGSLVELHRIDAKAMGMGDIGKPAGYNRRQVDGWTKRYFAAKTHDWPELEAAIEWLGGSVPAEFGSSIVHNDYKFDNVMLDPNDLTRVTAVLDWEMATIGDPLMDLGTTLGYWMSREAGGAMLSMPFNPRALMENISRQELVEMYAEASDRGGVPDMLFYYAFGTFKIAVIAQQIYARYVKGFTRDERFARFDRFVAALGMIAARAIERGSA